MLSDIRQLVAAGENLNQVNDDRVTLVSKLTCISICFCSAKSLLDTVISFLSQLSLKLHIASASGYRDVVCVLLENGADPNPADNHFWTPLHLAAKYGQVT